MALPFVAGLVHRYRELTTVCEPRCFDRPLGVLDPSQSPELARIGLDIRTYALWDLGRELALAIGCVALGTLLVRRVGTRVALLTAVVLLCFGVVLVPEASLAAERAGLVPGWLDLGVWVFAMVTIAAPWFLLPDGRFVPRWSWVAALITAGAWAGLAISESGSGPHPVLLLVALGSLLAGAGAQVYRYRSAATAIERQQLKWLGIGLLGWLATLATYVVGIEAGVVDPRQGGLAYPLTYMVFGALATGSALLFPFAWSMAILQHRLWDADRVLSRGAIAATVAVAVALTYVLTAFLVAAVAGEQATFAGPAAAAVMVGIALLGRDRVRRRLTRLFYGERDAPYDLLAGLWEDANEHPPDAASMERLARRLAASLRLSAARIQVTGDTGRLLDRTIGEPLGTPCDIALTVAGEDVGVLTVWPRPGESALPPRDVRLVAAASAPLAHLGATVRLMGDLRRTQRSVVTAREEERRLIHHDLHDDLGPTLAGQALLLDAAAATLNEHPERAHRFIDLAKQRADDLTVDVRRIARDLRPGPLDQLGLAASLRRAVSAVDTADVSVEADIADLPPLPAATETALYRIVTEALTNALRHSEASRIRVRVAATPDCVRASVSDDGRGGTPAGPVSGIGGVGLRSMRERAEELGGRVEVTSAAGVGTTVELALPTTTDRIDTPSGETAPRRIVPAPADPATLRETPG